MAEKSLSNGLWLCFGGDVQSHQKSSLGQFKRCRAVDWTTLQIAHIVLREVCLDAHGLSKINNTAENLCITIVCVVMS